MTASTSNKQANQPHEYFGPLVGLQCYCMKVASSSRKGSVSFDGLRSNDTSLADFGWTVRVEEYRFQ